MDAERACLIVLDSVKKVLSKSNLYSDHRVHNRPGRGMASSYLGMRFLTELESLDIVDRRSLMFKWDSEIGYPMGSLFLSQVGIQIKGFENICSCLKNPILRRYEGAIHVVKLKGKRSYYVREVSVSICDRAVLSDKPLGALHISHFWNVCSWVEGFLLQSRNGKDLREFDIVCRSELGELSIYSNIGSFTRNIKLENGGKYSKGLVVPNPADLNMRIFSAELPVYLIHYKRGSTPKDFSYSYSRSDDMRYTGRLSVSFDRK